MPNLDSSSTSPSQAWIGVSFGLTFSDKLFVSSASGGDTPRPLSDFAEASVLEQLLQLEFQGRLLPLAWSLSEADETSADLPFAFLTTEEGDGTTESTLRDWLAMFE